MKKLLLIFLLLTLIGGGYWLYDRLTVGPERSLYQAFQATQQHDMIAFERYVDVESVTSDLVDQVAAQGDVLGPLKISGLGLQQAVQLLKHQLVAAAREEAQEYVQTGSLKATQTAPRGGLGNISILGFAGKIVSADSKLKGVKYVKRQGREALVGIEFTQPHFDTTMVLELKMLDQGDHWQVKQITNTGQLLKQVMRREKQAVIAE
ncbi:hypothetical protein [Hymenobacter sp. BT491]|uniref:hypothetical protein n=1 Tax=Hymenobacter sp. BT491 TaxID=2766779 RepID=UPI00165384C2|nr:hypothetical protein [Hymenobacter sp. BT491]MBC6991752.1 hypothetical protein [Hymenobacter sp. BT491]